MDAFQGITAGHKNLRDQNDNQESASVD
jgi:hypothetical protein